MSIDVTPSTLSERVAEEIRVLMARRRIRQSELARKIGTNDQWLSVRLRGVQPIDLNDLEVIAAALGVTPADLLGGKPGATSQLSNKSHKASSVRPRDNRPPSTPQISRRPSLLRGAHAH